MIHQLSVNSIILLSILITQVRREKHSIRRDQLFCQFWSPNKYDYLVLKVNVLKVKILFISWGSHSRTHTHDMDNKSHHLHDIGIAASYCFVLHIFFLHPMANLSFFSMFVIDYFYIRLMRPNKVETGRGLLK